MRAAHTNQEIMDAYLTWARDVKGLTARTVYQYEGKLQSFLDFVGPMPLADVGLGTVEHWITRERGGRARGSKGQPATLSRDATVLGNMFRFGVARGWLPANPVDALVTPTVKNKLPKPIPDETWLPLWSRTDLSDEARVVLGFGYFGGLRREEVARLRAVQVDTKKLLLVAFTRKGGGEDVLDLDNLIGTIEDGIEDGKVPDLLLGRKRFVDPLRRVVRNAGDTVLGWRKAPDGYPDPHQIYRRFERWGCDFTPHQTRHSFVTNLLRVDVPIHLVSNLANHADIATTMRYAKLGGQDLREFRRRRTRRSRWEQERGRT